MTQNIGTVLSVALATTPAPDVQTEDLIKRRLYNITSEILGSGSYGSAAKAFSAQTGSPLVAKTQNNGLIPKIEGNMLTLLQKVPHIVRCRDVFLGSPKKDPAQQQHYIMMNMASGKALSSFILRKTPDDQLTCDEIVTITQQLLEVLAELRKKGIAHFDLKPANIFFNRASRSVTVIDFGGARHTQRREADPIITPVYCAPEFFLDKPLTTAYDLWSLGCTLYLLLTDRALFPLTREIPKADQANHMLQMIAGRLGKPSLSYLLNSPVYTQFFNPDLEFRNKVPLPFHLKWEEVVRETGKTKGWQSADAEAFIEILSTLLRYENRPAPQELLNHPLFQREFSFHLVYEPIFKCKLYVKQLTEEIDLDQHKDDLAIDNADLTIDFHSSVDPHLHLPRSPVNQYLLVLEKDKTFFGATMTITEGESIDICEMQKALAKQTTKAVRNLTDVFNEEDAPASASKKSRVESSSQRTEDEHPAADQLPRYSLRPRKPKR